MTPALVRKSLQEARALLLGCGMAIFAFCWLRVWLVSQLDTSRFQAIIDLLPDDWRRFTPVDFDWLITYTGRISLVYDELIVVLCMSIWGIARGSDSVSGELGRGTMESLLAQPYSRWRVLATPSLTTIAGVGLLAASAWLGTAVGIYTNSVREEVQPQWELPFHVPGWGSSVPIPFAESELHRIPMRDRVDTRVFLPGAANLFALGFLLAAFSTLMSAWDRYRWRTIGIVVGTCVVQVIVKVVGLASDSWSWLLYLSVFTAYEPEHFVQIADRTPELAWSWFLYDERGQWLAYGPLWYDGLLIVLGFACFGAAFAIFQRRDIPAPL